MDQVDPGRHQDEARRLGELGGELREGGAMAPGIGDDPPGPWSASTPSSSYTPSSWPASAIHRARWRGSAEPLKRRSDGSGRRSRSRIAWSAITHNSPWTASASPSTPPTSPTPCGRSTGDRKPAKPWTRPLPTSTRSLSLSRTNSAASPDFQAAFAALNTDEPAQARTGGNAPTRSPPMRRCRPCKRPSRPATAARCRSIGTPCSSRSDRETSSVPWSAAWRETHPPPSQAGNRRSLSTSHPTRSPDRFDVRAEVLE